jgi:NIMA (never in mitosis gene a)-related kinase
MDRSLGVILYELCERKPPFNADSMHFLALKIVRGNYTPISSNYSREMKNLVSKCLELNPDKRPSISEILGILMH